MATRNHFLTLHGKIQGFYQSSIRLYLSSELWSSIGFMLLSFLLGSFWPGTLVLIVLLGTALTFTWSELPVLAVTVLIWIGFVQLWIKGVRFERKRIAQYLGEPVPSPYPFLPSGPLFSREGIRFRARLFVRDSAIWRDLLYLVLLFPMGIAGFAIASVTLAFSLGMIVMLVLYLYQLLTEVHVLNALPEIHFTSVRYLSGLATGLLWAMLAPFAPYSCVWMARAHARLGQMLLAPGREARLAARVEALSESRSRMMDAVVLERQRIERDLHDGAQQWLVALAMNLGMAKEKMATDPESARPLVVEAHKEAKRALTEIRELVRGIHPAVLSDRGLDPAISALAGRCPVPVTIDINLEHRLPEAVEATAYFVVAEALTNVAKHSSASQAWVNVYQVRDWLTVEIADNGQGGAGQAPGHGLAGLADRVTAFDGRFSVESPPGGPTWVRAELPCGW